MTKVPARPFVGQALDTTTPRREERFSFRRAICLPECGRPRPRHRRHVQACPTFWRPRHSRAFLRPRTGAHRQTTHPRRRIFPEVVARWDSCGKKRSAHFWDWKLVRRGYDWPTMDRRTVAGFTRPVVLNLGLLLLVLAGVSGCSGFHGRGIRC